MSAHSQTGRFNKAALLLLVLSLAGFFVPWLSARWIISMQVEKLMHYFGIGSVIVVFCVALAAEGRRRKGLRLMLMGTTLGCFVLLYVYTWLSADRLFIYWRTSGITPAEWQQIANDLEALGKHTVAKDLRFDFRRGEFPQSLEKLGRRNERYGGMNYDPGGEWGGTYIRYGMRWRKWGLVVGPEEYQQRMFSRARLIPVATNGVFFVDLSD